MHTRLIVITKKQKGDDMEKVVYRAATYLMQNVVDMNGEYPTNILYTDGFIEDPDWFDWTKEKNKSLIINENLKLERARIYGAFYKDTVQLMTKKIYNIIKKKMFSWKKCPQELSSGNGYVYLEGEKIDKSLIGNSWVIAYDIHS